MARQNSGVSAVLAIALLPMAAAKAQEPPNLMSSEGTCKELVVDAKVLTSKCQPILLNSSYDDGRVGFYFLYEGHRAVTFSGMDLPNPTPDTDEFAIDKLINTSPTPGKGPDVSVAEGICSFGNPYIGPMTVRCSGKVVGGKVFSATFETDGNPPK
jgi:hypothetical protein